MNKENFGKRVFMSLFGVIICAISVGIFKIAALGVDPFQSFMAGLDALVPIQFGILYVIANAVLFIFLFFKFDFINIGHPHRLTGQLYAVVTLKKRNGQGNRCHSTC